MDSNVVIIMTCYNRKELTDNSIRSIIAQNDSNYHILVVDDCSDVPYEYAHDNVTVIRTKKRKWISRSVACNFGINYAFENLNPDIIIMQNSEVMHCGNVIEHVRANISKENYMTFACLSLPKETDMIMLTSDDVIGMLPIDRPCVDDFSIGWYNHSVYYPRYLDFCSAITADNMYKLNGYDERFSKHMWFDDDNFRDRVGKLGLTMSIEETPFVAHQWHSRAHHECGYTKEAFELYNKTYNEKEYKAKRSINKDIEWIKK